MSKKKVSLRLVDFGQLLELEVTPEVVERELRRFGEAIGSMSELAGVLLAFLIAEFCWSVFLEGKRIDNAD